MAGHNIAEPMPQYTCNICGYSDVACNWPGQIHPDNNFYPLFCPVCKGVERTGD